MAESYMVISDAGSLRVGNAEFQMLIDNGLGDGTHFVHITDEEPKGARFRGAFQGENVNIYAHDCYSDDVVTTVTGSFMVWTDGTGDVYLLRFGEAGHFGKMGGK